MFQEVEKERERGRESGSEERASPEGITARRPMFFSGEGQTIRPLAQPLLSPSPLPARGAVRDSAALRGRRKRNPCQERAKEEQEQEEEMRREPRRRKASGGGDAFAPLRSPSALLHDACKCSAPLPRERVALFTSGETEGTLLLARGGGRPESFGRNRGVG